MKTTIIRAGAVATAAFVATGALAADSIVAAVGQRGFWDTGVTAQGIEQGFFAEEDLDVEIVWTQGGAEQVQAVATGSAQIGIGAGTPSVIAAFKRGAPLRVVSAQMTGSPDVFWYVKADSDIQSVEDLDGRTMAFSRPGSSSNVIALELAASAGVEPEFVSSGGASATRTQVMTDQLDAGWSVPPFALDLVEAGEARVIGKGNDNPDLAGVTLRVNIANSDFLEENRDVVERFFSAYQKTIDWMYENQGVSIPFYAEMNEIPESQAKLGFDFYPKESMKLTPISVDESVAQAVEYEFIDEPLTDEEKSTLFDSVVE